MNTRYKSFLFIFILLSLLTLFVSTVSAGQILRLVDNAGWVGSDTSLALNSITGFPVISYYDATNGDLKIAICGDATCATKALKKVDTTGNVGKYTSLVLNSDNIPVISYLDVANGHLKVAVCGNTECTSGNAITTVDDAGDVGYYTSLALNTSGYPVISYYDNTNGDLKVAVCWSGGCTSSTVDAVGDVGMYTSLELNSDGFPVISYYDNTNGRLKIAVCGNATCTFSNTITTVDDAGNVGFFTSLALNSDGFPVISYYDNTSGDLKLAVCGNIACDSPADNTIVIVDSAGNVGQYTSLALDNITGFPVISYTDLGPKGINVFLKVAVCGNATCTFNNSLTTVDTTGQVGQFTSLALNSSGYVISYLDVANFRLKVAVIDNVGPDVAIGLADGQAASTNVSPINFTVIFSEPVSDFGATDVTLSGTAGATTKSVTGGGAIYNMAVGGMTSPGDVTVKINSGVVHDLAGNDNNASDSITVTYNGAPTMLTVDAATGMYGVTADLKATLKTESGTPISGKIINFVFNDGTKTYPVDSAFCVSSCVTGLNGVAIVSGASLAGIDANTYSAGVEATFAGAGIYAASSGTGSLTVNKALASVTPNVASKIYGADDPVFNGILTGFLPADEVIANYSRTAGETVALSPYTISATLSPAGVLGNYTITYNTAGFIINKADPTLSVTNSPVTYNGSGQAAIVSAGSVSGLVTNISTGGSDTQTNAGDYAVTAGFTSSDSNYNNLDAGTSAGNFRINKADSSVNSWPIASDITYGQTLASSTLTGGASEPTGSFAFTAPSTAPNAGIAQQNVTFTPIDTANYKISFSTVSVTVNRAPQGTLNIGAPSSLAYGGSAMLTTTGGSGTGTITYSVGGSLGCSVTDNILSVTNISLTCSATATKAGDSNYNSTTSLPAPVVLTKAPLSVTANAAGKSYDGLAYSGGNGVAYIGFVNSENSSVLGGALTYSGSSQGAINAGSYTITPGGLTSSNYAITFNNGTLTITKAFSTTGVTCPLLISVVYTGFPITPTPSCTVSVSGAGGLSLAPTPVYANNTNVGNATASYTYAGDLNHTGSSDTKTFATITKVSSTTVVTCSPTSVVYTGSALTPCTVAVTGVNLSLTRTPVYASNTNVGTATASYTYAGDLNHTGSSGSTTFTITKASSTTVVTCSPTSVVYTGLAITPCTVLVTGASLSLSPTPVYANNTNVGTTATASYTYAGDLNHTSSNTDSKTFEITKAPTTTVVTCPASVVYTSLALTPCTVAVTGANLSLTPAAVYADNTIVGTATASYTYADDANYTGSSNSKTFAITKADAVITWPTASAITYGDTLADSTLSGGISTPAGSFAFTTASMAPNAGTALQSVTFTPNDIANYNIILSTVSVTVNKAISIVNTWPTASDITYGQTLADSILNDGDSTPVGNFAFTTPSTAPNAGIDPQDVTFTPTNPNYTTVTGTVNVTVQQATPTLSVTNPSVTYDGLSHGADVTSLIPGTVHVDTILTGGLATQTNVGIYAVTANFTPTDTTNYKTLIGESAGDFEIKKATPTVDWTNPADITYGTPLSGTQLNATASAFDSPVDGSFTYTPAAGTTLDVGAQTLSVNFTPTSVNYDSVNGTTVTINVKLAPPSLVSPANATALNNKRPTFSWSSVSGADSYTIQISTDSDFTIIQSATITPNSYALTSDLAASTRYYWRVRSNGINVSDWSSIFYFTTSNPPSVPVLASPANAALVLPAAQLFNWGNSTVPAGVTFRYYTIQIARDSGFTSIFQTANITGITNSQFTSAALVTGTTYYWRVRSVGLTPTSYSSWSAVRTVLAKFTAPTLLFPANVLTPAVGDTTPTFKWRSVHSATSYTIQIAKNSTFTSGLISVLVPAGTTYTPTTRLTSGATYYWRVRVNGAYTPVFSAVWKFKP